MAALNVLTYSASIMLPSGQVYTFSGVQTLGTTSVAALQAAATAMGADISNQLVNGTANDPSLASQQTVASTQG